MIWLTEYCPVQNAVHIDPLEDAVRKNRESILAGTPAGYMVIGVFSSQEEASRYADEFRAVMDG